MLLNGCRESFNEISRLPEIFYQTIKHSVNYPPRIPDVLKASLCLLITSVPLGLYDRDFGSMLLDNFVNKPIKGFCWLIADPIHVLPIAFKQIILLTAVAVMSLAVGLILGIMLRVVISGTYYSIDKDLNSLNILKPNFVLPKKHKFLKWRIHYFFTF